MQHPENLPCETERFFMPYLELTDQHSILDQLRITGRILYSFEAKRKISKLLDKYPVDVAHFHDVCYHISPSILHELKRRGIPVVMTLHDFKMICTEYYMYADGKICEVCRSGRYYMPMLRRCIKNSFAKSAVASLEMYLHQVILDIYNNVDIFISPSLFLKKKLEEKGFNKEIVHLYNFYDLQKTESNNDEIINDRKEKTISYIGRLSQEKGLITLLKAAKLLLRKEKKIQFSVIGDGPLMKMLQEKVRGEEINNVRFLGYMKHDALNKEIIKSIAVILPSEWYENNPMAILEAFALGKPVIGSKIGGIPELVEDYERGLTFEANNPEDLISKIQYLVDNPEKGLEMGRKAMMFLEKELNSERHYSKLMKIYKSILKS